MRCFASPRPAAPHRAAPELPSKESSRGSRGLLCCRLQLLPQQTGPCRAEPVPTETRLVCSPKRAAGKACALLAAVCSYCLARTRIASPHPAGTDPATLGLTPKDAQHDQAAVSASIRLRLSVTGITSVLNRPCLGLQSPKPTSLPASPAISATSPRFSTSGSY